MIRPRLLSASVLGLLAFLSATPPTAEAQGPVRRALARRTGAAPQEFVAPAPFVQAPAVEQVRPDTVGATATHAGKTFCIAVRMHLRRELVKQGMGFAEAWRESAKMTDDVINHALPDAEKLAGAKVGQIGDGTILQAIIDFLKSPQGQAIIAALVQMLLHMIGGQGPDVLHQGTFFTIDRPPPLYLDQRDLIGTWSHSLAA